MEARSVGLPPSDEMAPISASTIHIFYSGLLPPLVFNILGQGGIVASWALRKLGVAGSMEKDL